MLKKKKVKFSGRLRGLVKIDLGFRDNIGDIGKTLGPAVSPGTKLTPHSQGN